MDDKRYREQLPLLQPTLIVPSHLFCCGVEVPKGARNRGCAERIAFRNARLIQARSDPR